MNDPAGVPNTPDTPDTPPQLRSFVASQWWAWGWAWVWMVACVHAGVALACGPFLPARILTAGDEHLLRAPVADFRHEVQRMIPEEAPAFASVAPAGDAYAQTTDAGRRDLDQALAGSGLSLGDWRRVLVEYDAFRAAVAERVDAVAQAKRRGVAADAWVAPRVPPGLPREFELYLRGAAAYHAGNLDDAVTLWRRVLDLPAERRRHRSVWAAYMLGKAALGREPGEAVAWFEMTRQLAGEGFIDSLGLAASSLGWEGKAHLELQRYDEAMRRYFEHWHSGDPSAVMSLRTAVHTALLQDSPALGRAAVDPLLQRIVTAYLLSKNWPRTAGWMDARIEEERAMRWLTAVEAAGDEVAGDVPGADRLAWLAYQRNQVEAARRWAEQAEATPIALWVRSKLALRDGDVEAGTALLAQAVRAIPREERWSALTDAEWDVFGEERPHRIAAGELATLRLSGGRYAEALALLLDQGYNEEAAYIAEHVLTIGELKAFVDGRGPEAKPAVLSSNWYSDAGSLRDLLARRLTRAGRWDEARPYFAESGQKLLDQWTNAIRMGRDEKLRAEDRADALWFAAALVMTDARWLVDFYAEPTWHVEERDWMHARYAQHRPGRVDQPLSGPGGDELRRLDDHAAEFARERHYPFIAAELAWESCGLMKDNDERLSYRLCIAGSWIMYRDPKAADRWYKALCTRCDKTDLGRQAIERRWFPKLVEDELYLVK